MAHAPRYYSIEHKTACLIRMPRRLPAARLFAKRLVVIKPDPSHAHKLCGHAREACAMDKSPYVSILLPHIHDLREGCRNGDE